jgi:hypothetical protein
MRVVFCVAVLLLVASPSFAANARVEARVIWYGDSYQDTESGFGGIVDYMADYGINNVWTVAKAGAEALVSTGQTECSATDSYKMHFGSGGKGCNTTGLYQMKRHPTTSTCKGFTSSAFLPNINSSYEVSNAAAGCGTTGSGAGDDDPCCGDTSCVPTCLEDLPTSTIDLCVIEFGTNDTAQGADIEWTTGNQNYVDFTRDFEAMVNHAESYGLRCVIVTGIPYQRPDKTWNVINARMIANWIRDTLIPAHPTHTYIDMLTLFDQYEAGKGSQAAIGLYKESETNADDTACDTSCIHPGENANTLGEIGRRWYAKHIAEALVGLARR